MEAKQKAVIFDLDGTIANLNGRKPFGPNLCEECVNDLLIESVAEINELYARQHPEYEIIIISGRNNIAYDVTENWLQQHQITYDQLIMRPDGNFIADDEWKESVYRKDIEPFYDVRMVFEDRPRVVRMWRRILGTYRVMLVGEGIEF